MYKTGFSRIGGREWIVKKRGETTKKGWRGLNAQEGTG
jgi:hypothetical protein